MNIKPGFYYNNSQRTFEIGSVVLGPQTRIHSENPEFAKIDARVFGYLIHEEKLLSTLKERFSDPSEYVFTPEIVEVDEIIIPPIKESETPPVEIDKTIIEPIKEPETPPQVTIVEVEEPKVKKPVKPKK